MLPWSIGRVMKQKKNYCDLLSLDTKLLRLLPNPNALVATSKGSKTLHRQNPPVLD